MLRFGKRYFAATTIRGISEITFVNFRGTAGSLCYFEEDNTLFEFSHWKLLGGNFEVLGTFHPQQA
jgi:hypothetical protein